jgi:hypothetical protein
MPPIACPCDGELVSEPDGDLAGYIPASKVFFGRGAIQLSWNYNFRAASEALTGDSATFCEDPDLVAVTPEYAWGAGVFFWMENLKEETTCHIEAMRGDFGECSLFSNSVCFVSFSSNLSHHNICQLTRWDFE